MITVVTATIVLNNYIYCTDKKYILSTLYYNGKEWHHIVPLSQSVLD